MATVKVIDLIDRAEEILQDVTNTRWSQQTLLDYLNDAQREIVLYRPDANPVNASFTLAADSSKQTLPAAALRLMKVYKNLSPNKSSIAAIDRAVLDDKIEDWYEATGTAVEYYVYDGLDPKIFYVYPHTTASNATIELVYSSLPSEITISNFSTATDVIGLDDIYANALMNFVLYRAFLKDAEYAANAQRAGSHYQLFTQSLAIGQESTVVNAPTTEANVG